MSKWSPEAVTDIVLKAIDRPGFVVILAWRDEDGRVQSDAIGDLGVISQLLGKVDAPREAR